MTGNLRNARALQWKPNESVEKCTNESEEANALRARAPAAEEADCDNDASNNDQNQRHIVEYKYWLGRVVTQQYGIEERLAVDVNPDPHTEHRPTSHLHVDID